MIRETQAFVLKKYKFRETSLIVHFYTREFGKIRAVAKGVRDLKSRKLSHFEAPVLLDVTIYSKPNRELQLLSDSYILDFFDGIKSDLDLYLTTCYGLELIDSFTQDHLPSEVIFRLLLTYFSSLRQETNLIFTTGFLAKLLKTLGIFPNLLECCICHQKIKGDSFLNLQQGGVLCSKELSEGIHEWDRRIEQSDIHLMYELIKDTFQQLEKKPQDAKRVRNVREILEFYINYFTQLRLKTQKVYQEIANQ